MEYLLEKKETEHFFLLFLILVKVQVQLPLFSNHGIFIFYGNKMFWVGKFEYIY